MIYMKVKKIIKLIIVAVLVIIEKLSFKKGEVIPNTNYNNISLISSESESYPKKNENFLI